MTLFLVIYILSQAAQIGSSFWLSDWTNKVEEEKNLTNGTNNGTNGNSMRNTRLLVYFGLGSAQSNLEKKRIFLK